MIMQASPTADVDSAYRVSMPMPATFSTDVDTVLCFIACTTSRASLTRIGRVYLLYLDTKPLCFIGDELRELIEAPTILHAVVFAGFGPTTCACRALAYACKGLYFDGAHALLMGMVHHLPGKLMVDIFHPTRFFALAFLDGADFLCLLELLTSAVEASAHMTLISAIPKEARSFATDMSYSRHLDAKINPHDAFLRDGRGFGLGHGHISDPLAPLLLDAQQTRHPHKLHLRTSYLDALHLAIP